MNAADPGPTSPTSDLDTLWNPHDLPGSEAAFQALLAQHTPASGSPEYVSQLQCMLARSQALQGKFEQARASLDNAKKLLDEHPSQESPAAPAAAKIRWLIEEGRLHILLKTPSQARTYFTEAWNGAMASGEDYFVVEVAQLLAVTEPPKTQQKWIERAIEIAEASSLERTRRLLGGLYTSLAWKLYDLRQYEKALETFRRAQARFESNGCPRDAFVARWAEGKALRALGRTEEALAIQKALLATLGIGGERDGRLYEELAECLHTLKRTTEAQLYFELAYRELSKDEWARDNRPLELKRLKGLGNVK